MNTADIRSMGKHQWVFWASAVPVTIVVIALSLFAIRYFEPARQVLGRYVYRNDFEQPEFIQIPGDRIAGQAFDEPPPLYPTPYAQRPQHVPPTEVILQNDATMSGRRPGHGYYQPAGPQYLVHRPYPIRPPNSLAMNPPRSGRLHAYPCYGPNQYLD